MPKKKPTKKPAPSTNAPSGYDLGIVGEIHGRYGWGKRTGK